MGKRNKYEVTYEGRVNYPDGKLRVNANDWRSAQHTAERNPRVLHVTKICRAEQGLREHPADPNS